MLADQITIVGVGLIGGSLGLAVKSRGLAERVVGVDREPSQLARAVERGIIDSATTHLAEGVGGARLVVVCAPVNRIAEIIVAAASHCRTGTVFTDVGSTKANIVAGVLGKLPPGIEYVPAHPLAGSEKSGAQHALPSLFADRLTVVTPHEGNSPMAVEQVVGFWRGLGARILQMTPEDHDRAVAITSHLPHVIAATAAGVTPVELLPLTAGGFRDVTRIAAGNPQNWAAIFQANRESVLATLTSFTDRLAEFRKLLEAGDEAGIIRWLSEAKQVRDALGC